MKDVNALRMTAEDCLICKIFMGFMATPLLLLVLAGATQALWTA